RKTRRFSATRTVRNSVQVVNRPAKQLPLLVPQPSLFACHFRAVNEYPATSGTGEAYPIRYVQERKKRRAVGLILLSPSPTRGEGGKTVLPQGERENEPDRINGSV